MRKRSPHAARNFEFERRTKMLEFNAQTNRPPRSSSETAQRKPPTTSCTTQLSPVCDVMLISLRTHRMAAWHESETSKTNAEFEMFFLRTTVDTASYKARPSSYSYIHMRSPAFNNNILKKFQLIMKKFERKPQSSKRQASGGRHCVCLSVCLLFAVCMFACVLLRYERLMCDNEARAATKIHRMT